MALLSVLNAFQHSPCCTNIELMLLFHAERSKSACASQVRVMLSDLVGYRTTMRAGSVVELEQLCKDAQTSLYEGPLASTG